MKNYLLIDASNVIHMLKHSLQSYDIGYEDMEVFLKFVHYRPWITSNFELTPIWCMDHKPYWRQVMEPIYKNKFEGPCPIVEKANKKIVDLGFPCISLRGFEADDIAANLVRYLDPSPCYLLSGDSDWMGLVSNRVTYLNPMWTPFVRTPLQVWTWMEGKVRKMPKYLRHWYKLPVYSKDFDCTELWKWKALVGSTSTNLPPGMDVSLVDLFNPIVPMPKDVVEQLFRALDLKSFSWRADLLKAFALEMPYVPFNPIRLEEN